MKIVAFVPAKGSSERVPGKNLALLDGEPLVRRKLRQLLACDRIDELCLDTECDTVAAAAADLPVSRLARPPALASNATDGHALFAWECAQRPDADIWIQALATAPFLDTSTIARAIERLLADPEADSLVAVSRQRHYRWERGDPVYGRGRIPNGIELPESVVEAMSLYIVRRSEAGLPAQRFGRRPILFELDATEQIDIDTPADFALAETIAAGRRAQEVTRFRAIRPLFSSTILADAMKARGLAAVVAPGLRATSGTTSILGRARTLQLAALPAGPHPRAGWDGIYGALDSYRFVRPGDVIMVATEVPDRAYFGDLNAGLALRAGAVGAVIDGATRDSDRVSAMDFPVVARGRNCDDIKYEGTLAAMNRPVRIGGVTVANDDIVFADGDGVVVIPAALWPEIEPEAWRTVENEARIRVLVAQGAPTADILAACGAF